MLSSSVLTQITPFQAKSLVEIVCDANGSRFEMNASGPKVINLPGDFAKLCRILYKTLQDIPISDIRAVVKEDAAVSGQILRDYIEEYAVYFRSDDLFNRIEGSQHDKVSDARRLLRNEEYLDRIVAEARYKVSELQGDTNIYMMYSRVADTRASLRKRACTRRAGNNRYFDHQPDLYEALENDYWEYLRTFPDMYDDDTLNMSKILGANREKVFYNLWFREKFAKHLQGVSTVQYEGEDLPTWQILNTSFKQHVSIDLVEVMNLVIEISSDMFKHGYAQNTANDISLQYSIFEYYLEKKLKVVIDHLNSAYTDILRTNNHKIKIPFKLRNKCKTIFRLNTELGVGRRLSGTGVASVDASFRARVRNNRAIIAAIDEAKDTLSVENIAERFADLERNAYFATNPGKDSNRPYFEHTSKQDYEPVLYTPDGFNPNMAFDLGVDIVPGSVYQKIGKIIKCLCDLENLDAALERYGLSIVDMPPLTNLNRSYYEQVQTLDGLINDMINQTYVPSVSYEDGYGGNPISGLTDSEVNKYLAVVRETLTPVMTLDVPKLSGKAALAPRNVSVGTVSPAEQVFMDLSKCRILFNSLTQEEIIKPQNGVAFSYDPYRYDLPLCNISSNQGCKIPQSYSANKAQAVLLTIMQGLMFQEFNSQSSLIEYGDKVEVENAEVENAEVENAKVRDIAIEGLKNALIRGQGKFIMRMLGVIPLVRKCYGHFNELLKTNMAMHLWKMPDFKRDIDKLVLAQQSYDKKLERTHRKSIILLGSLLDELMSPDPQYIVVEQYLDYIGEVLSPIIFPTQRYTMMYEVKGENIQHTLIFNLDDNTTTLDGIPVSQQELSSALKGIDVFGLICSEVDGQLNCVLYCAYSLFLAVTSLANDFLRLNLPHSDDRHGFGLEFGSCVDIFATNHYMSVALKAKINSMLYKVLPTLNTVYQAYNFEESDKNIQTHYHAVAMLLNESQMIHELNNMFNSIDHLSKYFNNDGAFDSFNKIIGSLGIPSYLNNLHIGFMSDEDYKIFQVNLMCSVLNHVLQTDAADWVAFARNFVKSEQGLREIVENVASLKCIQMAATNHDYDPFPMYARELMQELSSDQVTLKLLTLNADSANAATLSKFMVDKAVDPDTGFVIWKTGNHFVHRTQNGHLSFVHSKGLVFDRDPTASKFDVYTLTQAINDWRLFS